MYKATSQNLAVIIIHLALIFILALGFSRHTHAATDHLIAELSQECPRPELGLYEGSCEVRDISKEDNSSYWMHQGGKSSYPMHIWMRCMLRTVGMGNGGYQDALFYQALVPEWENEIEAQLQLLNKLLTERDKKRLKKEQKDWMTARTSAIERKLKQPSREGSMYGMLYELSVMELPEHRALELGCRIQKLIKH